MRCYTECVDYELEDLGDEEWLTGCPLCGDNCWEARTSQDRQRREEINKELDNQTN
jgi:hypothetical protein